MTYALKVSTAGNSACLMLPKAAVERLNVGKGDVVYLTEGAGGEMVLTAHDPDFAEQMEAVEKGMKRYRNALKALADR